MNKFFKLVLKVLALDALLFLLCLAPSFLGSYSGYDALGAFVLGLLAMAVVLLVQLVVGLFFSAGEKRKELGQALMLSSGIIILIGFSVCGGMGLLG